jgi:hypothetical protein
MGSKKSKPTAAATTKNPYNAPPHNGGMFVPGPYYHNHHQPQYYQPQVYQSPSLVLLQQVPPKTPPTNFGPVYPLPAPGPHHHHHHHHRRQHHGPRIIDEPPVPLNY